MIGTLSNKMSSHRTLNQAGRLQVRPRLDSVRVREKDAEVQNLQPIQVDRGTAASASFTTLDAECVLPTDTTESVESNNFSDSPSLPYRYPIPAHLIERDYVNFLGAQTSVDETLGGMLLPYRDSP